MPHFFDETKLTKLIHEGKICISGTQDLTWGDAAAIARIMVRGGAPLPREELLGPCDIDENRLMTAIREGELSVSPSGYPYSYTQARENAQEMIMRAKSVWRGPVWE